MKNRNIVDYLGLCHTFCSSLVRILYSTHGGWNRLLTERSFLLPVRADHDSVDMPQSCTLDWTSAWYLPPCQTCWHCSSSWQSMVCFCTTTWMKCSEVKKHHKTASFSSNHRFWSFALNIRMVSASLSNMLTLSIEFPDIFLYYDLNKMFGSGQEHHKTPFFHQNRIFPVSDHISHATVRVRASSPAWR